MNFKIRVVENIGSKSCELFGCPGTVLEVKDGILQDNDEFEWANDGKLFHNLEEINMYFMVEDVYQTRFEMAEEKSNTMPKAILELEMPESCTECMFKECLNRTTSVEVSRCIILHKMHVPGSYCPAEGRQADCPLKLVEDKKVE